MRACDRPDPLEPLVREHRAFLERLVRSLTADAAVADDLVQETWLHCLLGHPSRQEPLRPWLRTVMLRRLVEKRRSERPVVSRTRLEEGASVEPPPVASLLRREARDAVEDALLSLRDPHRTAIALRYLEGWSTREVARHMTCPEDTVRTHVKRGLAELRARLPPGLAVFAGGLDPPQPGGGTQ